MDAFADKIMNHPPTATRDFDGAGIKKLQLETQYGDIELIGHHENYIRVEVFASVRSLLTLYLVSEPLSSLDTDSHLLNMNALGDTLKVFSKPDYFNPVAWFNSQRTSFRVFIPASIDSVSKTYAGTISLRNLHGNHVFSTWGGGLFIQQSQGKLQGKTMGGNIVLVNNQVEITANTMGGNITVQKHNGKLQASTWGGNIKGSDITGDFECNTMGGNIKLKNMNGNVGASTKGGNITAELHHIHQYAWFDSSGGKIKVAFPFDSPTDLEVMASKISGTMLPNFDGYLTYNDIKGKLNGGGPSLTIKNRSGNVFLNNIEQVLSTQNIDYQDINLENTFHTPPIVKAQKEPVNYPKPTSKSALQDYIEPVKSFLFALLFCVVLVYGLSAVIYFTFEFLNPKSALAVVSKGIFYSNLNNGVGAFVSAYLFIHFFEFRIKSNLFKYLNLSIFALIYTFFFQSVMWFSYWRHLDNNLGNEARSSNGWVYFVVPPLVSCAYFFYWQRTRQTARKISEQEYQLLNLEKLKSKAQLDALEAKINPHFLYNSLNSIAGLIHEQPDKAEEMTIQLSKLFRYSTGRSEENFHSIADELEIIKAYLSIEQVRFGTRLNYTINCESDILSQKIPRFLLQPLVENAIKHGISKVAHEGQIKVEISQQAAQVCIKIHDNGPAFGEAVGGGFGLRSIKQKLKIVYAEKATFEIQNEPEKAVIITLPI
ncbi:MAG: hypothetical protein EAZ70_07985 [Runella slithyformis]|nr:MAG: hypothetical protein EAZ70_07985 [Runella slithyformis]TAF80999.1 MAG: hypothetical protein EAZ50_07475 [Runella slithyformis]